jgi:hypothetical protein
MIYTKSMRWLRGMIERLRENTKGGDHHWLALLSDLDAGALIWVGRAPFRPGARKIATKAR